MTFSALVITQLFITSFTTPSTRSLQYIPYFVPRAPDQPTAWKPCSTVRLRTTRQKHGIKTEAEGQETAARQQRPFDSRAPSFSTTGQAQQPSSRARRTHRASHSSSQPQGPSVPCSGQQRPAARQPSPSTPANPCFLGVIVDGPRAFHAFRGPKRRSGASQLS